MIADLGRFSKLRLRHQKEIEQFVSHFPPYSDYNFTSLYTYNTENALEFCYLNHNLVIKFSDYLTNQPFLSFLGKSRVLATARSLVEYAKKQSLPPILKLIPETVIEKSTAWHRYFKISQDRNNFDYIVSVKEIANLPLEKFRRKRALIAKFKKQNPHFQIKWLDLKYESTKKLLIQLFKKWEKVNQKKRSQTETELMALKRLCDKTNHFSVYTLVILIGQQPVAFNTYEITHDHYGISSFQKADKNYRGIYSVLSHEVAKHLDSLSCRYINYEQDLGFEGLRLSKSLWKPAFFLKKYSIEPK